MSIEQALQVIEQARQAIQLKGSEADLLRESVYIINEFVKQQKEKAAQVIPMNNGNDK